MKASLTSAFAMTFVSLTHAVNIETAVDTVCDVSAGVGCYGVAAGVCCRLPGDILGLGMFFGGLPISGIGSAHIPSDSGTCGSSCGTCTAPDGGNCCVGCNGDGLLGGLWTAIVVRGRDDDPVAESADGGSMEANYVRFGEQYFHINGDVPQEMTNLLIDAVFNGTVLEDLPESIYEYIMPVPV